MLVTLGEVIDAHQRTQNVRFICWNQTLLLNVDVDGVCHLELTAVGDQDRLLCFPTL